MESSADKLRRLVRWINNTQETALDGLTVQQLLNALDSKDGSDYDWTLCDLTEQERRFALHGVPVNPKKFVVESMHRLAEKLLPWFEVTVEIDE